MIEDLYKLKPKQKKVDQFAHNEVIERHRDAVNGYDYFWSLVQPAEKKKKRKCMKCQRMFDSSGSGHRMCGRCGHARINKPKRTRPA